MGGTVAGQMRLDYTLKPSPDFSFYSNNRSVSWIFLAAVVLWCNEG